MVRPLKWGILGAARIAGKSLIPAFRASGAEVVAVGASGGEKAQSFAKEFGIAKAYEGYQRVIDDPNVEAIYLPLANGLHKEWAIKTAQAGKACLCEKPMVMTTADAREICDAFSNSGAVIQEAFMWRHHPQIAWIREQIEKGVLGELRSVHAQFSFTLDRPSDYRWKIDQGGGAFWDIGCYCVNSTRLFFGCEPQVVSARGVFGEDPYASRGVDASMAGWLDFGSNRLGTFTCSFTAAFAEGIELVGTNGRAWMSRPWLQAGGMPLILIEEDNSRQKKEFEAENGYVPMIQSFTAAVRSKSVGLGIGEDGVKQAAAMEGLMKSAEDEGAVQTVGHE